MYKLKDYKDSPDISGNHIISLTNEYMYTLKDYKDKPDISDNLNSIQSKGRYPVVGNYIKQVGNTGGPTHI